jgi:hypothetical protein
MLYCSISIVSVPSVRLTTLLSLMHPMYTHRVLPTTLGVPARTREEYIRYLDEEVPRVFARFRIHVQPGSRILVMDLPDGAALVHLWCKSEGMGRMTHSPYGQEYSLEIWVQPDIADGGALKIREVTEMVDSAFSVGFFRQERSAWELIKKGPTKSAL